MGFPAIFCCGRSSDRKGKEKIGSWRVFSLKELHAATNNFNYDNKLGEGGIGSVYWGQLWDGSQIAVKRLKIWSERGETEFPIEVEILGKIRHKDLLCLRGYCNEGQERLIVYDYMSNLSLHTHLHGQHSLDCHLDWKRRMNIALGAAEGIEYLHHHSVIHRDIKARNVLLDSNFNARVADFGLAKLVPEGSPLAPEYVMLGKDARKSCDVYSYGILLLELISGKKATDKLELWALPLAQEDKFDEIVDPKLNGNFIKSELRKAVLVGLICTKKTAEKRPTMLEVVDLLKAESKEKMSNLENDEMFKKRAPGGDHELSGGDDNSSSDSISCEKRE